MEVTLAVHQQDDQRGCNNSFHFENSGFTRGKDAKIQLSAPTRYLFLKGVTVVHPEAIVRAAKEAALILVEAKILYSECFPDHGGMFVAQTQQLCEVGFSMPDAAEY